MPNWKIFQADFKNLITTQEYFPECEVILVLQDGATPLFLAAQEGHVTVIRQLLSSGAKVNQAREVISSPNSASLKHCSKHVVTYSC